MTDEGILDSLILVGSWCVMLYQDYFKGKGNLPPIRTRDIEFLIPIPPTFARNIDMHALIEDLGFIPDYRGEEGHIIFQHPELILEFLVPQRGRERKTPYPVPQLGINAQALRFMDLLAQDPIRASFQGLEVSIPHPANFSLQKLLIAKRRKEKDKAKKDRFQAVAVLRALEEAGEFEVVISLYHTLPMQWRKTIKQELAQLKERNLLQLLEDRRT